MGTTSNDWSVDANWQTGSAPTTGDTVYIDGRGASAIAAGLNQSAVTLAALYIDKSMQFAIGTLTSKLRISATKLYIGRAPADGSRPSMTTLVNLDLGSVQSTGIIYDTRDVGESNQSPVQIIGTHASNAFTVMGQAKVGFGTNVPGEATTIATLTVKDRAIVEVGSGVTLTTVNPEGGDTILNCALTTIAYGTGNVRTEGTGAITNVNVGGHFTGNSTGTITNLNVYNKGFGDFEQNTSARTVTNVFIYGPDAKVSFDNGVPLSVTVTNGVDCLAGAKSSQANYGDNLTVTQSAL